MKRICGTCQFSAPAIGMDKKIDFTHRLCKWEPAKPVLLPRPDGQGLQIQYLFPILDTSQWCGQWAPDATEALLPGEQPLSNEKADA